MFKFITDAVDALADSKLLADIESKVLAKYSTLTTKAPVAEITDEPEEGPKVEVKL